MQSAKAPSAQQPDDSVGEVSAKSKQSSEAPQIHQAQNDDQKENENSKNIQETKEASKAVDEAPTPGSARKDNED